MEFDGEAAGENDLDAEMEDLDQMGGEEEEGDEEEEDNDEEEEEEEDILDQFINI